MEKVAEESLATFASYIEEDLGELHAAWLAAFGASELSASKSDHPAVKEIGVRIGALYETVAYMRAHTYDAADAAYDGADSGSKRDAVGDGEKRRGNGGKTALNGSQPKESRT
jgi:hypothetical protein